jgi:hypothetical protein
MKTQLIVLLLLVMSLSYPATYSLRVIPAVYSSGLLLDSAQATGLSTLDPTATANFLNNITIKGNLNLTGNNVVNLVGLSSSTPVNVYVYGSIFINDNATLILKYVTLYFMGATKPYSCNITLSSANGHPHLNVVDAKIIAVTGVASRGYSYGAAIFAYNKSMVTANQLSISRQKISKSSSSLGGPAEIKCFGQSSVFLESVNVESMLTYDEANVTVYGGTITSSLALYNSSVANLYGVSFPATAVCDNAHLVLARCNQLSGTLTSTDYSRVDIISDTKMASVFEISRGVPTSIPGINATGNSQVYFLSGSSISSSVYGGPVISVYDNATFVFQNGTITEGAIIAHDNSNVSLSNTPSVGSLENVEIIGNDSSSVSISGCSLWGTPRPIAINLFDSSYLSIFNSQIISGYIVFSDNSTAYVSNSLLETSSRIIARDNANLTVTGNSDIENSIELQENAKLSLKSSIVSLIYCSDSSKASFVNGSIAELSASDNSVVDLTNSTVQELSLAESNVTGQLSGLGRFLNNVTLTLPGSKSQVSVLDTTVNNLDFSFSGNSNVDISNSTLNNLSLQGSSTVTLKNALVHSGIYLLGNSNAYVYSSLNVRCVDYFGNPLDGSIVTVHMVSGGAGSVQKATTNKTGWASLVFFSEIVNATGSYPLSLVTVSGSFGGVTTSDKFNTANAEKSVTLSLPIPWWSGYILPVIVLVGIVVLLILVNYVYKHVRARR